MARYLVKNVSRRPLVLLGGKYRFHHYEEPNMLYWFPEEDYEHPDVQKHISAGNLQILRRSPPVIIQEPKEEEAAQEVAPQPEVPKPEPEPIIEEPEDVVEEIVEEPEEPAPKQDYSKMRFNSLKRLAKEREIGLTGLKKKADIIAKLEEWDAEN